MEKWKPEIEGEISYDDLYEKLKSIVPNSQIILHDEIYKIPKYPEKVIKILHNTNKYINEKYDCDDYVRIARGWLSENMFGDLLVMDILIALEDVNHKLLGFLHNDKIIFGEPQTGEIVNYDITKILRIII